MSTALSARRHLAPPRPRRWRRALPASPPPPSPPRRRGLPAPLPPPRAARPGPRPLGAGGPRDGGGAAHSQAWRWRATAATEKGQDRKRAALYPLRGSPHGRKWTRRHLGEGGGRHVERASSRAPLLRDARLPEAPPPAPGRPPRRRRWRRRAALGAPHGDSGARCGPSAGPGRAAARCALCSGRCARCWAPGCGERRGGAGGRAGAYRAARSRERGPSRCKAARSPRRPVTAVAAMAASEERRSGGCGTGPGGGSGARGVPAVRGSR